MVDEKPKSPERKSSLENPEDQGIQMRDTDELELDENEMELASDKEDKVQQ